MKTKKLTCLSTLGISLLSLVACSGAGKKTSAAQKKAPPQREVPVLALSAKNQQLIFEEDYIKGKFSYGDGQKFIISMLSNIGNIAAGVAFDSPTSVVGGIFSMLGTINDQLNGSSGPTIQDVMNKLNEMDTKLDGINQKLDENYNQLMTEEIRTQAMVDQVLLEEMEAAISSFNTNYSVPIENFTRDYSDYLEQSYKAYVSQPEASYIAVYRTEDGEWGLTPIDQTQSGQVEISYSIESFPNAKECLEKNYNVVTKGFMDALNKDIDKAIKSTLIPLGLDRKLCRDYIGANIVEKITKKYYEDNHQKALDIRNMSINYSKQISGKSVKSVIDRYVSRLEYMYNFAGEMKESVTDAFANIIHNLDINTTIAAQACMYAGVNQEEIKSEYITARELIQKYYENIQEIPDNYCFLSRTNLGGGFYQAKFNPTYTNKGNDPKLHSELEFYKVNCMDNSGWVRDDANAHDYLDPVNHTRIITRWKLMREIGLSSDITYVDYLTSSKVLDSSAYNTYKYLVDKWWITNDALRFMTGITVRDLNDSDKSLKVECVAQGTPNGDYFYEGWKGTFRGTRTAGNWSGKIAETTYVDATSGEIMSDKKVAAYCTYNESHWYWVNDEHWAFVDNAAGNYFFVLENVD